MGCDFESQCNCRICREFDQYDRHAAKYIFDGTYTVLELTERITGLSEELGDHSDVNEIRHISYALSIYSHLIEYAIINGSVEFSYG